MLGLIYDVHGNLPALEAVLADAPAEFFVLGGDFTLFGAWPAETLELLEGLDAEWIRGNGERWSADPGAAPEDPAVQAAIEWVRGELGTQKVGELAQLPAELISEGTRFLHGSPVSDVRSFAPKAAEDESELLEGVGEDRLVFGHTHLPFIRRAGGIELVNPGSVGMPFDGDPRASYALVGEDGAVEHRRVGYDHAASAAAVRARIGEPGELFARRIESATF
ncbi:MAG: metallophosphoesterase family protein [Thermoleophilaceae bacterium]|nr:metallophosphoesterase family protein [Thermoleophilaceae bacterium]